jgi:hypothetical protein
MSLHEDLRVFYAQHGTNYLSKRHILNKYSTDKYETRILLSTHFLRVLSVP